ncbi:GMC oxidoreductase-domain-containing protein [Gymnopilus junonius]|uniref:pyranose dehydrogenase (acceptor) n=1 Tax=Gymnopilus junonius TaxID=109634 RepID=A0A9P5NI28_GYMJU|nr:GMC oxidoreductase-domain-containing protein [Gymnopilus junonius]
MLCLELLLLSFASFSLSNPVHGHGGAHARSFTNPSLQPRNYITPDQRFSSYDYIIAGGGLAGLVLANRLSANSSNAVLVLEAGPSGDAVASQIDVPATTYFDTLTGSDPYDWVYKTAPQTNAGGRVMTQPRGRVLGGSSAVNGMYLVRPSQAEVDAWSNLIAPNDQTAANNWNWDSFFASLKSSETFTPPVADTESVAGMQYVSSSHGTSGPVHATYPGYMVPVSSAWFPTLQAVGISISPDSYSGVNIGGMFATSAINPSNWTRSYSKSAYIDPLPPRANLHIISGATVERVVFSGTTDSSGNHVASGVQFSTGEGTQVQNVTVNKEVLVCGGAMGSPHLLLVSGVGPQDVLSAAGVPVVNELPGVGQHFQDHLAAPVSWSTTVDTQGSIHASGDALSVSCHLNFPPFLAQLTIIQQTPEFNSFINSGVAYVNGSLLFGGDASFATFQNDITGALNTSASTLVPSQYSQVVDGYKAVYQATSEKIYPTTALAEILLSLNSAGQITVQAAVQQPLSQGRIYINSSSIYDKPVIDPQYFSHPADIVVLRQGIKLARQIGAAAPLKNSLGAEVTPGPSVQSDADIEAWLRTAANTEFHPSGGCSMLPQAQGGVVDAELKVYGLSNVRVIDSSVFPVSFAAHLMTPTYALAEKASSLILTPPSTTSSSPTSSGSTSSPSGSTTPTTAGNTKSGSVRNMSFSFLGLLIPVVVISLL